MRSSKDQWAFERRAVLVGVLAGFVILGPTPGFTQQSVRGTYLEIAIEGRGPAQLVKLSLGPERLRLDTDDVSLVSMDGDMLIMQHAERVYLELTAEMIAGFASMMGGRMPPSVEQQIDVAIPPTFTRTGNTKNVGEWSAYEVRVEHPEQDGELHIWFSQAVDADFREIAGQTINAMSSLLNNPMLARMGGGGLAGGGGGGLVASIRRQLVSIDTPDGFPVQFVSTAGGEESTGTLRAITAGTTFDPTIWEAADGYQKMQIPLRR